MKRSIVFESTRRNNTRKDIIEELRQLPPTEEMRGITADKILTMFATLRDSGASEDELKVLAAEIISQRMRDAAIRIIKGDYFPKWM